MPEHVIRVSKHNWQELNSRKDPGESFDDVVQRLVDDEGGETIEE